MTWLKHVGLGLGVFSLAGTLGAACGSADSGGNFTPDAGNDGSTGGTGGASGGSGGSGGGSGGSGGSGASGGAAGGGSGGSGGGGDVDCTNSLDCAGAGKNTICDTVAGKCVECLG